MDITSKPTSSAAIEVSVATKAQQAVQVEKVKAVSVAPVEKAAQVEGLERKEDNVSTENLEQAVSQLNDYVQNLQRTLQFTVDEESGKDVVTVSDVDTKEIIRQYPSEEVLAIARQISQEKDETVRLFSSRT